LELSQKRILIVDDTVEIHQDFLKIFEVDSQDAAISDARAKIFGKIPTLSASETELTSYVIDSAYQGQEGLELVRQAKLGGQPYALAFVDIRMPPGWDGIETIQKIWEVDTEIQIVICSAYSDYSWENISQKLHNSNNFLILKKPFEVIEICQLASALTNKWELNKQVHLQIEDLKKLSSSLDESLSLTRATLDSTMEGILVLDRENKVVMSNNVFLTLWNMPESILTSKQSETILQYMANQMESNNFFLKVISRLGKQATLDNSKETIKEWKLKSGKILELYTHPQYLHDEIIGTVCSFRDVSERKKMEEQLIHQAMHDSLTGLPNRVLLLDRIQQAVVQAKRRNLCAGVLLIDLDNFKQVNDSLGHSAGDDLLIMVAKKLSGCVRESDTVTRLGGDEFVIVLSSQLHEDDLMLKAFSLLELFKEPFTICSHNFTISMSIGVSLYPHNGYDPETLLKNADAALYYAKEMGKNQIQRYQDEFNKNILQRAQLITELKQALQKEELTLHYQPLVELNTNKILGVEALLRWTHPTLGVISPNVFIPLAEETGLIIQIGEWVLRTACQQNTIWHQLIDAELTIAVNISGLQFQQHNFVELVKGILKETRLDPRFLELEVTESLILKDISMVTKKMSELKALGIRFAMDDFGTGYASLNYLKCFPFDKVKIDKSFVDGITLNSEDSSIVEAIIGMTKTMGIDVLAEGVEKSEQVDFLREHHSNQVQGYYFSPPVNANKLSEMLKNQKTI